MKLRLPVIALLLIASVALFAQSTTPTWIQISPGGELAADRPQGIVGYDPASNRLIVVRSTTSGPWPDWFTVWALTGANGLEGTPVWVQVSAEPTPWPWGPTMLTYDPVANRLLYVAGVAGPSPNLNRIRVLTHANGLGGTPEWLTVYDDETRGNGYFPAFTYDPASARLTVFGGVAIDPGTEYNSDVWVLEHANAVSGTPTWTRVIPSGEPPPVDPSSSNAVYDAARNRLIMLIAPEGGGPPVPWVLTGANGLTASEWIRLDPVGTPPPHRSGAAATYDPNSNRLTLFAGCCFFDDVWVLTNANGLGGTPEWIKLAPDGSPGARRYDGGPALGSAYEAASNRLMTLGNESVPDGVWVLTNASGITELPVSVDLKPDDARNVVNPHSHGLLPIAILSTSSFDARTVNVASVRVGNASTNQARVTDVDGDGDVDLLMHVATAAVPLVCGQTQIGVQGATVSGVRVRGSDTVVTVGCR